MTRYSPTVAELRRLLERLEAIETAGSAPSLINKISRQKRETRAKLAALGVNVEPKGRSRWTPTTGARDVLRDVLRDQVMTSRRLAYLANVDISHVNLMTREGHLVVVGRAPLEPGQPRYAQRLPLVALPEHAEKHRSAA